MVDLPRRPGFTAGTEEDIWHGRPALRSTFYLWTFSSLAAYVVSDFVIKLISTMYVSGYLSVFGVLFVDHGHIREWVRYLPWIICLWPVAWYTLGLIMTSYSLTSQRLAVRSGILMRTYDQVELFRVRDFMVDAPIHLAILGLGHVRVISRDDSLPILTMIAQSNATALIDLIRANVQRRKDEVGVRELETSPN